MFLIVYIFYVYYNINYIKYKFKNYIKYKFKNYIKLYNIINFIEIIYIKFKIIIIIIIIIEK